MPDYKEMYLKLFRASNQAIEILISAQQECEELCCAAADSEIQVLDFMNTKNKSPDKPET